MPRPGWPPYSLSKTVLMSCASVPRMATVPLCITWPNATSGTVESMKGSCCFVSVSTLASMAPPGGYPESLLNMAAWATWKMRSLRARTEPPKSCDASSASRTRRVNRSIPERWRWLPMGDLPARLLSRDLAAPYRSPGHRTLPEFQRSKLLSPRARDVTGGSERRRRLFGYGGPSMTRRKSRAAPEVSRRPITVSAAIQQLCGGMPGVWVRAQPHRQPL